MATGRYAPSPTGDLHLGNLRTALIAWLFARSAGSRFLLRIDDLDPDRCSREHEARQLSDLAAIGLDWDGEPVRQSAHAPRYADAIARLDAAGLLYRCYCTRREIREATSAPHGPLPDGAYPGTCRELTAAERAARDAEGRPPALRLRAEEAVVTFEDALLGSVSGVVDDFVVRRNDGAVAYNLATAVDDGAMGVEQVVRGADLVDSTPRQLHVAAALGIAAPAHAHVPLVLGPDGERLAKRHGSVTLADRAAAAGEAPEDIVGWMAWTAGLIGAPEPVTPASLVEGFDPARLTREPTVLAAP